MQFLQTPSFQLACYSNGNDSAEELFLFLPGFLDAGDYDHLKSHREHFADRGYFCISFDPPGTFASPGDIEMYTITNYLEAIDELIAYYGNKKTTILGHSLGGSIALLASSKNPAITQTISIMSPYSLQEQFSKAKYARWKSEGIRSGVRDIPASASKRNYAIPYSFVEDAMCYDLVACIKTLKKPKLFIAGLQDDIIPCETVKEGFDIACDPKVYGIIDGGHNYRFDPKAIEEVNKKIESFISNNIHED